MENKLQPPAATAKSPLDQLQAMLYVVLEETAHVFVEANRGGGKDRAAATAARLRAVVPNANNASHDALDELEGQLITARWVLNRDLDALREQQAIKSPVLDAETDPVIEPSKDVEMADAPSTPIVEPGELSNESLTTTEGDVAPVDNIKQDAKPVPDLSIDTSAKPGDRNDQPETTTGMSTIDFDSLFNDPASATGTNSLSDSPKVDDSEIGNNGKDESQQSAIGAVTVQPTSTNNNEDISSLLPGLESYANAADDKAIDIKSPTPTPAVTQGIKPSEDEDKKNNDDKANPAAAVATDEKPDTTFDDLMNFADFDFSSFGDMGDGDPNGSMSGGGFEDGAGRTFDESFFDVE